MLVLSRKESERIRVGDSIVVTVVRLTKDRVRLGIEAPDDVLVLRDELEKDGDILAPAVEEEPVRKSTQGLKSMVRRIRHEGQEAGEEASSSVATKESKEDSSQRRCPERKYFRW